MILINPDRTPTFISSLTALWETSVRATHYPLSFFKASGNIRFRSLGISILFFIFAPNLKNTAMRINN